MKNKLTICGFIIISSLIALVTGASASNIEPLSAYVAQFRIFVDGEERDFENPIVTINDRTYIPLREISEVLGMNVEWDGENREIIINKSQMLVSHTNENKWDTLYAFEKDGLWGYNDAFGNVIIEPRFKVANIFSEGLAFVVDNADQRGYIDLSGNLVIPLQEGRYPHEFSQGFALVVLREWDWDNEIVDIEGGTGGPFVFIGRTGENVFGMEFADALSFEENGLARVIFLDGIKARIDTLGNIVDTSDWTLE